MLTLVSILITVFWTVEAVNITYTLPTNKAKRTLSQSLFNYGETRPFLLYSEAIPTASSNDNYSKLKPGYAQHINLPQPINYFQSPQNPPQQTMYEFSNLQSSSNLNQLLQPTLHRHTPIGQYKDQSLTTAIKNEQFIPAETMVLPVEHKDSNIFTPQHIGFPASPNGNTNIAIVPKYSVITLKKNIPEMRTINPDVYKSSITSPVQSSQFSQFMYQPQVHSFPLFPNHYNSRSPKAETRPIVNFINRHHTPKTVNANIPKYVLPSTNNNNVLLNRRPIQTKPNTSKVPLRTSADTEHKTEVEDSPKESQNDDDNENDDNSEEKSVQQDDERDSGFYKDSYDFEENVYSDDNDDKDTTEEEYDQDSKRGSTAHVNFKKTPNKHTKNEKLKVNDNSNYRNRENKRGSSEHRPVKKNYKTPKVIYKSFKYSKEGKDLDDDTVEGRQSENIPVTHKHKIFSEKWFFSKNTGNEERE